MAKDDMVLLDIKIRDFGKAFGECAILDVLDEDRKRRMANNSEPKAVQQFKEMKKQAKLPARIPSLYKLGYSLFIPSDYAKPDGIWRCPNCESEYLASEVGEDWVENGCPNCLLANT